MPHLLLENVWVYVKNKDYSVSSILFRKKQSWLQKPKYPHQLQESVPVMVTQQPPKVSKTWANKVQETEASTKVMYKKEKKISAWKRMLIISKEPNYKIF